MIRKRAFTNLIALAGLGLAMPGCVTPQASERDEQAVSAAGNPSHEMTDEHAEHQADHGGGRSHTGAAGDHGSSAHLHADSQRQEGAQQLLGAEVKDFTVTDNAGKALRLVTLRRTQGSAGKIAVLTFWCTTCMSCRGVESDLDKKVKEYESKGVRWLMVDSNFTDNAERVNRFLEDHDLSFPVLVDPESEIARYFGATLTTTTAVIDADGRLRYYGGVGGAEAAIRNLIAGEEVAVPESRGAG